MDCSANSWGENSLDFSWVKVLQKGTLTDDIFLYNLSKT